MMTGSGTAVASGSRRPPPAIDESIGLEARGSIDSNGDAVREDAAWKAGGADRRSKFLIGRELGFSVPDAFRRQSKDLAIDEFVPSRLAFGPDQEPVDIHAADGPALGGTLIGLSLSSLRVAAKAGAYCCSAFTSHCA